MYCARLNADDLYLWSNYTYGSNSASLKFSNICYNASPIYDGYKSDLITKPLMNLADFNGMDLSIENLLLTIPIFSLWDVYSLGLGYIGLVVFVVFGIYLIRKSLREVR